MIKNIIVSLINIYQKYISHLFPRSCRFYPSCSEYSKQAVQKYGPVKGLFFAISRVFRCHPWNEGGVDHVK